MAADWYIERDGKRTGPVSSSELKSLAGTGKLLPTDLVRKDDSDKWVRASNVRGLITVVPPPLPVSAKISSPTHLSFYAYFTEYFSVTRGLGVWGIVFAILAAPVLSLLKPAIGFKGMVIVLAGLAITSCIAFVAFTVARVVGFLLGRERTVSDEAKSWPAFVSYTGAICAIALLPALGAEYLSPPAGLMATLVPQLMDEQARWRSDSNEDEVGDGVADAKKLNDSVSGTAIDDQLNIVTPISKAEPDPTDATAPITVTVPSVVPKNVTAPEHLVDKADRNGSAATESTTQLSSSSAGDQRIISDGVGATPDDALKDAFRNAVRQVVGAVVDAETLIQNDEIIKDTVLTYSDGFIKKYEEVAGSKTASNGLHRVTIHAEVERRSVIAKLKSANVTMKPVAGKSLFAEAVTQLDAEKGAASLLREAIKDFPTNVIQAEVSEEPKVKRQTDSTATLDFKLQVAVDLMKYDKFTKRLIPVLEKIATQKGECFVEAAADDAIRSGSQLEQYQLIDFFGFGGPDPQVAAQLQASKGKAFSLPNWPHSGFKIDWWKSKLDIDNQMVVVVNTYRSHDDSRTHWKWYHVVKPKGFEKNGMILHTTFLDADDTELSHQEFKLPNAKPGLHLSINQASDENRNALLATLSPYWPGSPIFRTLTISQEITLALDEVQRIANVKVTVLPLQSE